MKVIFTGLPYFSQKLVLELRAFDPGNSYHFFDTYYSKPDKVKYLMHLNSADLVVSFNGAYSKSKALDAALSLGKKIMMQWHGSDVMLASKAFQDKTLLRKYMDNACCYTDAPWLQEELKAIGVEAEILHFKYPESQSDNTNAFETFDAVSYVAEGNEEFYGIKQLLLLAEKFPDTLFHIAGTHGKGYESKPNVKFYGWLDKEAFGELRKKHPVFIRLTEHDGYALSVLEALSSGNEVIWNYPHPMCHYVDANTDINLLFEQVQNKVKQQDQLPRKQNIEWVKANFSKEKIISNFVKTLKRIVES